ncbi:PREDICTED: uncharacterized protein LOC105452688 isoform X2 [Wasmannia auropunctata]|uniref:uncharacterized protein LOC105452688 isoform X2 n=1 Tax=Wasmannia auropunctata TaxID=64793 RepID=UPI0005F09EBF|nr:PREDICTED: uncharacterized protein LOC105452688 isoform X2 [Wasmannia auropunctata]
MKLLLLLSLIILVSGDESLVAERTADGNDVSSQVTAVLQAQPGAQQVVGEKRLGKRSYDLLSVPYVRTYTPVLPWYRLGGLSSYGLYGYGWYPGWPLSYGSGWHGGWYKGW